MYRPLLLILVCSAWSAAAVVADQALRYVNNEVVTMGDVATRNQQRIAEYSRRGIPVPQNRTELIKFSKETLEDLTDESLLVQEAKTLKAVPDREAIVREVLEAAKGAGSALTLRDRTDQIRLVLRSRTVERILGFYESVMPAPTPTELRRFYDARQGEFLRPPRVRALRILMRPSPPEARAELRAGRNTLMRNAQGVPDPGIQALTRARLEAFLAGDAATQESALDGLVSDLAAIDPASLDSASATIVEKARRLRDQAAALRSSEDVVRALSAERMQLVARWGQDRETAFRAAAQRLDVASTSGGQLGWIEPGTYSRAFDDVVFNLAPGGLSEVFAVGDSWCVVLVAQRDEAKPRPFAEVVGELEMRERRLRRGQIRTQMIGVLRAKSSIRDITTLDRMALD